MNEIDEKVLGNLLRRHAKRRGLEVMKCRSRDPKATGYGLYKIVGEGYKMTGFEMTLQQVVQELQPAKFSKRKTVLDTVGA